MVEEVPVEEGMVEVGGTVVTSQTVLGKKHSPCPSLFESGVPSCNPCFYFVVCFCLFGIVTKLFLPSQS